MFGRGWGVGRWGRRGAGDTTDPFSVRWTLVSSKVNVKPKLSLPKVKKHDNKVELHTILLHVISRVSVGIQEARQKFRGHITTPEEWTRRGWVFSFLLLWEDRVRSLEAPGRRRVLGHDTRKRDKGWKWGEQSVRNKILNFVLLSQIQSAACI